MNPYESPTQPSRQPERSSSVAHFSAAAVLVLAGVVLGGPGFADQTRRFSASEYTGARYATYDTEFFIFGFSVSAETACILACAVAPLLFAVAGFLIYRGKRVQQCANDTPSDPTT